MKDEENKSRGNGNKGGERPVVRRLGDGREKGSSNWKKDHGRRRG
jgi:hypothetical protein